MQSKEGMTTVCVYEYVSIPNAGTSKSTIDGALLVAMENNDDHLLSRALLMIYYDRVSTMNWFKLFWYIFCVDFYGRASTQF